MEPFKKFKGKVAPLNRSNIDTDAIIPKQYLKSIKKTGFGDYLFDEWRYTDKGEPGDDCSKRPINTQFVLNFEKYKNSSILLTGKNFGCGSSREHAAWAFSDFGFKTIIAESFADIFFNNCTKNGILPIQLPKDEIENLFKLESNVNILYLKIDLENQSIKSDNKYLSSFHIDDYRKKILLKGLDEIGQTLKYTLEIENFEKDRREKFPWLF